MQLDAKQQKNLAKKDLEELDRQNAQFDQTNDTDQIAIVARLAADGAERWISVIITWWAILEVLPVVTTQTFHNFLKIFYLPFIFRSK